MLLEKKSSEIKVKVHVLLKKWPGNGHFVIMVIIILIRFAFLFLTSGSFIYYDIVLRYNT